MISFQLREELSLLNPSRACVSFVQFTSPSLYRIDRFLGGVPPYPTLRTPPSACAFSLSSCICAMQRCLLLAHCERRRPTAHNVHEFLRQSFVHGQFHNRFTTEGTQPRFPVYRRFPSNQTCRMSLSNFGLKGNEPGGGRCCGRHQ